LAHRTSIPGVLHDVNRKHARIDTDCAVQGNLFGSEFVLDVGLLRTNTAVQKIVAAAGLSELPRTSDTTPQDWSSRLYLAPVSATAR
jgi:hypothetical protein